MPVHRLDTVYSDIRRSTLSVNKKFTVAGENVAKVVGATSSEGFL